jgi:hypothetical protein
LRHELFSHCAAATLSAATAMAWTPAVCAHAVLALQLLARSSARARDHVQSINQVHTMRRLTCPPIRVSTRMVWPSPLPHTHARH